MVGPSADRTIEWEGGSLGELVAMMQAAALPVRIEVIARGTTDTSAGEVHLLAGGLADAFAGSLRRDDALAALQRLEGARYLVEARLPDPETGSLSTPGPQEGSLKDRALASLMRYCEEYVLTCRLEVWRGQERAVIGYRRGEIISTTVGGAEGSERLPEVMAWTDGSYEIVLSPPPQAPPRKGTARPIEPFAKTERKRHGTLPLVPGSGADPAPGSAASASAGPSLSPVPPATVPSPIRPAMAAAPAKPTAVSPPPATQSLRAPALQPAPQEAPARPPAKAPPQQAPARAAAPPAPAEPPVKPAQPDAREPAAKPSTPSARPAAQAPLRPVGPPAQQQPLVRQPPSGQAAPQPAPAPPALALGRPAGAPGASPEQAPRPAVQTGVPASALKQPVPAAAQTLAARSAGPSPMAAGQAPGRPHAQATPGSPTGPIQSDGVPATAAPMVAAQVSAKPPVRALTPAMGSRTATPPKVPLAAEPTARGTPPVPMVPLIPAPARPAAPPPLAQSRAAAKPPAAPVSTEQPAAEKRGAQDGAPPPAPAVLPVTPPPFQLAPSARPSKTATASNDLKPASGTIEAKSRHPNHLPPAAAPIEIAEEANPPPDPRTSSQTLVSAQASAGRPMRVARRARGDQSFKVYILIGLAIGAGVVVAYWAYWYLPFLHH